MYHPSPLEYSLKQSDPCCSFLRIPILIAGNSHCLWGTREDKHTDILALETLPVSISSCFSNFPSSSHPSTCSQTPEKMSRSYCTSYTFFSLTVFLMKATESLPCKRSIFIAVQDSRWDAPACARCLGLCSKNGVTTQQAAEIHLSDGRDSLKEGKEGRTANSCCWKHRWENRIHGKSEMA